MAAAAPTPATPQALILRLQSQVATLKSGAASAGPAPATVVFADTPQSLYANDLIDYSTKQGSSIYEQGCKTLDDIRRHCNDYLDSKLINLTHKALMTLRWASTRSTGVNITWRGACISTARRSSHQSLEATPPPMPLQPPLSPTLNSKPSLPA